MTRSDDPAHVRAQIPPPPPLESAPPALPQVDLMASAEMQAWIARLQAERQTLGTRNKYLGAALAAGILLLVVVFWTVYSATVGAYAVVQDVVITRHPANQGRLQISFRVLKPGKVYYRRTSGGIETDVIDYFRAGGEVARSWAWVYEPGKDIDVTLWYRAGMLRRTVRERFPTADRADIVVLIDSTGSMTPFIDELQEKCTAFSRKLTMQDLDHRFALVGFGDAHEAGWLDTRQFTGDAAEFRKSVGGIGRFDGGDLPESALDAVEEALELPFDDRAIRRFYLVTDAQYHEPTRSGLSASEIAARLDEQRVLLHVFSRLRYEDDYRKLLGHAGRFEEIENFGRMLTEARVLED